MGDVMIVGASGHGEAVAEAVLLCGGRVRGFLDDAPEKTGSLVLDKYPVLGLPERAGDYPDCAFLVAIGNSWDRKRVVERLEAMGARWYKAIHPQAMVSKHTEIGEGTVVMPGAIIQTSARVGRHCIVNSGVIVEHNCQVGSFIHLCPGAKLGGSVEIGDVCHIGIGSTLKNCIRIAGNTLIGAGAVVVKDIAEEGGTYAGVPARRLR